MWPHEVASAGGVVALARALSAPPAAARQRAVLDKHGPRSLRFFYVYLLSAEGSLATLPAFFDVDFDRPPLFDKYESESR